MFHKHCLLRLQKLACEYEVKLRSLKSRGRKKVTLVMKQTPDNERRGRKRWVESESTERRSCDSGLKPRQWQKSSQLITIEEDNMQRAWYLFIFEDIFQLRRGLRVTPILFTNFIVRPRMLRDILLRKSTGRLPKRCMQCQSRMNLSVLSLSLQSRCSENHGEREHNVCLEFHRQVFCSRYSVYKDESLVHLYKSFIFKKIQMIAENGWTEANRRTSAFAFLCLRQT